MDSKLLNGDNFEMLLKLFFNPSGLELPVDLKAERYLGRIRDPIFKTFLNGKHTLMQLKQQQIGIIGKIRAI